MQTSTLAMTFDGEIRMIAKCVDFVPQIKQMQLELINPGPVEGPTQKLFSVVTALLSAKQTSASSFSEVSLTDTAKSCSSSADSHIFLHS